MDDDSLLGHRAVPPRHLDTFTVTYFADDTRAFDGSNIGFLRISARDKDLVNLSTKVQSDYSDAERSTLKL
jgi:hypothetical protein